MSKPNPSFNYDLEIFKLCQKFIRDKNHHGLALIARQKGLPPFLRYKIWPILLKYHPYVINPSIQPDVLKSSDENSEGSEPINKEELLAKIEKDLKKYLTRLKYTQQIKDLNENELKIFEVLKDAIFKFLIKWGKIIKYDSSYSWIALGLAEWFPPIPDTYWVLVGRDIPSKSSKPNSNSSNSSSSTISDIEQPTVIKDLFLDYSNYIENLNLNSSDEESSESIDLNGSTVFSPDTHLVENDVTENSMKFYEVFERLVLVLLHCPQNKLKQDNKKYETLNNEKFLNLPKNGGSIEERVTFFIYLLRKLLPELSNYFSEEQILNKFGANDDEWLIWWLKYCGSKVWSRLDRGKIWDNLLGFKFKSKGKNYNETVLHLNNHLLSKIGTDNFWTLESNFGSNSSTSLINLSQLTINNEDNDIPFPKMNPHVQLIFITLALLKCREHVLSELDQHEIRQYLSRLPTTSYSFSNKYQIFKQKIEKKREEEKNKENNITNTPNSKNSRSSTISDLSDCSPDSPISHTSTSTSLSLATSPTDQIISNDSLNNHSIDLMDYVINEAGELWRKWLYLESEANNSI
ncbi:oxidant-induced cell-cycle arrest protein 5 [[Candida] jaroonii]|uniref:Oxidant-induced cell-cycle arrest protein 5 n=1 Tax=[Candida] jaroonii TaxID=467808 RepID=A0ACA9Y2W6_9ASCO|nr:oxidant-induced cell-cycle arrest protein 5 [[Candida] jaroonii]